MNVDRTRKYPSGVEPDLVGQNDDANDLSVHANRDCHCVRREAIVEVCRIARVAARSNIAGRADNDLLAFDHSADAFPGGFLDRLGREELEAAASGFLHEGLSDDMTRGLVE